MTAIDFTAEVEKRKEDLLADLFSLLEINSERDDSKVDAEHPFGPGPVKALEKFLEIADRDGYPTKNVDNYAGHFEFGDGEEVLGIFAHMDVVPAGSGWTQIRTHQLSKMVASMRVELLMTRDLQQLATMA